MLRPNLIHFMFCVAADMKHGSVTHGEPLVVYISFVLNLCHVFQARITFPLIRLFSQIEFTHSTIADAGYSGVFLHHLKVLLV